MISIRHLLRSKFAKKVNPPRDRPSSHAINSRCYRAIVWHVIDDGGRWLRYVAPSEYKQVPCLRAGKWNNLERALERWHVPLHILYEIYSVVLFAEVSASISERRSLFMTDRRGKSDSVAPDLTCLRRWLGFDHVPATPPAKVLYGPLQ